MKPESDDISRILELLTEGPIRLEKATSGIQSSWLYLRTDEEPWSINDILALLRACSDVWGSRIVTMITQDNPTMRYVSPRSWMRKPQYRDQAVDAALASFTRERQRLVKSLLDLGEADWTRPGTFTGTSARQRYQTVRSYSERIVNHEQPHLDQVELLLK